MLSGRDPDSLLARHGLCRAECKRDWGSEVRAAYGRCAAQAAENGVTVADARCPLAAALVGEEKRRLGIGDELQTADIEPILIHCARELSERSDLKDGEKLITTPCRVLADAGNALGLLRTRFVTWRAFAERLGEDPGTPPENSPVPPGFFCGLGCRTASLSGPEEIRRFLEDGRWKNFRLLELLFCRNGCHNGDGVRDI